jgi:hypothetical protein
MRMLRSSLTSTHSAPSPKAGSPDCTALASFGSWKSPITAQQVVGESIRLGQIRISGDGIYWTEGRPQEKGRNAVVRLRADGEVE